MKKLLVETDFLFGLNARDKLHPYVLRVLELHKQGTLTIAISSAAPLEAALVLLSRGFQLDTVTRVLELMRNKLVEYNAENYTSLSCDIIVEALRLRKTFPQLTFFDSIHIATAKTMSLTLVTSDSVLLQIAKSLGIECMEYRSLDQVLR